MSASVKVKNISKIFALAEKGGGPVKLLDALRTGRQQPVKREVHALENISFSIFEGERLGIIGSNGAGKTTLLSLLAGLTEPSSGSIEVEGDVHAMLSIGAVLRDDLTGRENIYLDASMHNRTKSEIDAAASEIIQFTELDEFIERPVRTYSSGMKARLAFSMGAFINPDVLVLDETLAVGDAFFSGKAARKMKQVAAQGRIVILVTHSLGAVVEMCTRCLWLDQGRLVMDGDPKEVTAAYDNSVRQTDEAILKRKFGIEKPIVKRSEIGDISEIKILQAGEVLHGSVAAFKPLTIQITGEQYKQANNTNIEVRLLRVDGRTVWLESLKNAGKQLPIDGAFRVQITLDPFILGADLYRIEVVLMDENGACDAKVRVFEVVDEEGQTGGNPQIFYPPHITSRRIKETQS